MSKIIDCQLTSQGELDFDFDYGACNTFNLEEKETALLCFDQTNSQICHWFDGQKSSLAPWSSSTHRFTLGLASYKDRPLTTGSDYPPHRFTEVGFHIDTLCTSPDRLNAFLNRFEILDLETGEWVEGEVYPFTISSYVEIFSDINDMVIGYVSRGS